jgi:hypothetical protein
VAYGVHVIPQSHACACLAATRHAANAARAVMEGLGRMQASAPPPLYAFDPDTGRLAVTTPAYNTAIVAINHRAFPYGGLDIARLFDSRQEVAANIGGTGTAAFGLRVRDGRGRTLLSTQYGARARRPGFTPLRLLRAPRGAGATANSRIGRAYAGPFHSLLVTGTVSAHGLRGTSTYGFTQRAIEAHWTAAGRGGRAIVSFPSWGDHARIRATLRDGRVVTITGRPIALRRIRAFQIVSSHAGYRVTPLQPAGDARVRTVRPAPQSSEPDPGPTLEIALGAAPARFAARLFVDAPR